MGAERRVRRREERLALVCLGAAAERPPLDVPLRPAHGEQLRLLLQGLLRDVAQRRVVVEYVEPATERGTDEIVLTCLDRQIAKRDVGRTARQLDPFTAAVDGEEDPELGTDEEQIRVDVILHEAPHDVPFREVAGDTGPATASIGALQHVGGEVAILVVIDNDVNRVGIV